MRLDRAACPSGVGGEEWALVAPYLALLREASGQRDHELREAFDGLRWIREDGRAVAVRAARPSAVGGGASADAAPARRRGLSGRGGWTRPPAPALALAAPHHRADLRTLDGGRAPAGVDCVCPGEHAGRRSPPSWRSATPSARSNDRVFSCRWRDFPEQGTFLRQPGELALVPPATTGPPQPSSPGKTRAELANVRLRSKLKIEAVFTFASAAYNLVRIRRLPARAAA